MDLDQSNEYFYCWFEFKVREEPERSSDPRSGSYLR